MTVVYIMRVLYQSQTFVKEDQNCFLAYETYYLQRY